MRHRPGTVTIPDQRCTASRCTASGKQCRERFMPDDRKDDPAFLYFPTNYRWSMGLLICLGGAPWTGVDIDEVNRVGRALLDKVGDDGAWFEEWARMGDKIEARGRAALTAGHKRPAA